MKNQVKKLIYAASAKTFEEIIERINRKQVISFDVFNTLVKRDVAHPEDVFELIAKKIPSELRIGCFKAQRMDAEKEARKDCPDREVRMEEIYRHFPVDESVRARLIEMECEEEVFITTQNILLKRIYEYCIKAEKTVLFISDMYLPSETVKQILQKCGYTEGRLFVSSESGKMKRNGELFRLVRAEESIDTANWLHMGDSIVSDYLQPRRLGIESLLIDQNPANFPYTNKRLLHMDHGYQRLDAFINNRIRRFTDPYEVIGYGVLGPLLYGFSRWLEETIPADRRIIFLAREGALLQKAFSIISDRPSIYLHISRHAAYEAFLDHAKDIDQVIQGKIRVLKVICTKEEFARSCGLSDKDIEYVFQQNHFLKEELCPRLEDKKVLLDAIWPLVKARASGQYGLMEQYFQELGIAGKCSAVDVGWRGTIQALLTSLGFTLDGKPVEWDGYYMGSREYRTKDAASCYQHTEKRGYLFDHVQNKRNKDTIGNSVSFFELLFLSTEGTTKSYVMDAQNHVVPVLGQPDNNTAINRIIKQMQNAGIQFLEDIRDRGFPISADAAFASYEAIARVPTLKTLKLFQNFSAYDEHCYSLANDHSFGYYLLHPRQFMKEFAKKPNRAWFLKGTFKIPLPYVAFLNFLRFFFDEK